MQKNEPDQYPYGIPSFTGHTMYGTPFGYGPWDAFGPEDQGRFFIIVTAGGNALFDTADQVRGLYESLGDWIKSKEAEPEETYWIRSHSRPSMNHKVTRRRGGAWDCTCEDRQYRKLTCRHISEAMSLRNNG
jgi:hypothetical protein